MGHGDEMLAEVFSQSLGLGPGWEVAGAEFAEVGPGPADRELRVRVARRPGAAVPCPCCGRPCGVHDTREREWRHLDIWQFRTVVSCAVPRVDCPECGVRTAAVPWEAREGRHFTAHFEAQVLLMVMSGMTVSAVARALREPDTKLWRLVVSASSEARAAADHSSVRAVGVDETSCRRGQSYVTSFVDLGARRVLFCAEGRDNSVLADFAADLRAHGGDPGLVEEVTRDMSDAYRKGVARELPNARTTVDKFHVMQLFSRAVDRVRLSERGESDLKRRLLDGTKYVWLKNEENLTPGQAAKKADPARRTLRTARACHMREAMQAVYASATREEAEEGLRRLTSWMMHSNLPEMKKVARTLRQNAEGILNHFDTGLTNAALEGVNSVIQLIKRTARGFRNVEYYKAVIYIRLGKLSFTALEMCGTHQK